MKKILVLGPPGSGKTYFSICLSKILKIHCVHLDDLRIHNNGAITPDSIFRKQIRDIICKDQWIIDGNYSRFNRLSIMKADQIFILNLDFEICKESILKRDRTNEGKFLCDSNYLISIAERYKKDILPILLNKIKNNKNVKLIEFNKREQIDEYISNMKKET